MKKLVFIILAIISVYAQSATNVKVSDGLISICQNKADVYNGRFGAYRPRLLSIDSLSTQISVKLQLEMLRCEHDGDSYAFYLKNPFDVITYEALGLNANLKTVIAEPIAARVIFYRDGIYKLISVANLKNKSIQILDLNIKYTDLFSESEIISLLHGETIKGNFDYRLQRSIRINYEEVPTDINYGAFRVHFKARLDNLNNLVMDIID